MNVKKYNLTKEQCANIVNKRVNEMETFLQFRFPLLGFEIPAI